MKYDSIKVSLGGLNTEVQPYILTTTFLNLNICKYKLLSYYNFDSEPKFYNAFKFEKNLSIVMNIYYLIFLSNFYVNITDFIKK